MARKAKNLTTETGSKTYNRRTPEQQIADLQAKIQSIERRAAAKQVKAAPEGKPFLLAVKAVDKAIEAAVGNDEMLRALEAARANLGEHLIKMGVRAPVSRLRKGKAA